jgi:general secretion pathway protein D
MTRLLSCRAGLVVAMAATAALLTACASSPLRQAQRADELREYDVAVAQYTRELRRNPDSREAQIGLERARLRGSEAHLFRGRRLYAQGRYEDAVVELQIANELNPTSGDVDRELRTMRVALRAKLSQPEGGRTALQSVLSQTRDLAPAGYELPNVKLASEIVTGQQSTSGLLYRMIGRLASLSVTFDAQFRDAPAPVTLLSGMSVKQALDSIAKSSGTFYQLTGPGTIVVVPDTAAKRRDYTEEVARPFVIQNADLKEVQDALRVVADARYLAVVTGPNMIVVRGSPELVTAIGRFISAFDKARPEVIIDVEVLEVNRTEFQQYGLQFASSGSPGIDGSLDVGREGLSLQDLRSLTQADVLMGSVPALYYRLIKTDGRTRTLANPHIRITDGMPATASFGQSVPVPTTTFAPLAQGGINIQPTTSFAYRNIGVNLGITPRTHPNDDVTLTLNIELSSLGAAGFDGLPTFGTRSVTTTIRLRDGETNILAGLIREDERVDKQSIPWLGKVPVLGSLFASNLKNAEQTDVVVMLTPHIIRVLDLAEEDLRPLRIPRDGSGPGVIEAPSFVPPAPGRGGGGGSRH